MTSRDNALNNLDELETAQRKARQGKLDKVIDDLSGSKSRAKNQLKDIARDPSLLDDLD